MAPRELLALALTVDMYDCATALSLLFNLWLRQAESRPFDPEDWIVLVAVAYTLNLHEEFRQYALDPMHKYKGSFSTCSIHTTECFLLRQ